MNAHPSPLSRVAIVGNHAPRQCGIATFTASLREALVARSPALDAFVLAMNDVGQQYRYPDVVRFEIPQHDRAAYRRAADFLNVNEVDVVSVQHEYGIFGGKSGEFVLDTLSDVRIPIVTTLHTVLESPSASELRVLTEILSVSDRIVVMSQRGAEIIRSLHGVPGEKVDVIPHGIPDLSSRASSAEAKSKVAVDGRTVLLTFGLLSPDKGVEYVIDALPALIAEYPDVLYVILGETHPHVRHARGEEYRLSLASRAKRLGVTDHVLFHDRFVSQRELADFLAAADLYITPYLNPQQSTSGTLSFALGAGKAILSTPYSHACEVLSEGRGILVPFRDAPAIAAAARRVLADPTTRTDLETNARSFAEGMLWPSAASRYLESFETARRERAEKRRRFGARTLARRAAASPQLDFAHVSAMTDSTGILQHATFSVPRLEDGYCLDDNARGLLLMALAEDAGTDRLDSVRTLGTRYIAFVRYAFNEPVGRFRNFMTYSRRWTEEVGSEDSHGRALWALGATIGRSRQPGTQSVAGQLFQAALPAVDSFESLRGLAFTLLGIDEYLRAFGGDRAVEERQSRLAREILLRFERTRSADWRWFEDKVTYDNARVPQALLATGARIRDEGMVSVGIDSLEWLLDEQRSSRGFFLPVGSNGFWKRNDVKAAYDHQPLEAAATVSACVEAWRATKHTRWLDRARVVFEWFLGNNHLDQPLFDPVTGGCRDGMHRERLNENQGAESTLAFHHALLDLASTPARFEAVA
jgi:glycosyltransferase involved in cell wall biosynthesis